MNGSLIKNSAPILIGVCVGFLLGIITAPLEYWVIAKFFSSAEVNFKHQEPYFLKTSYRFVQERQPKPIVGSSADFDNNSKTDKDQEESQKQKSSQTKFCPLYLCRFVIENKSSFKTLHGCRVKLEKLWYFDKGENIHLSEHFEPVYLVWPGSVDFLGNIVPVDIAPGEKIFARLFNIFSKEYLSTKNDTEFDQPKLQLGWHEIPLWMDEFLEPKKYRLLVKVYFDDRTPIEQKFEFKWSGKWNYEYNLMKKEVEVTKIDN